MPFDLEQEAIKYWPQPWRFHIHDADSYQYAIQLANDYNADLKEELRFANRSLKILVEVSTDKLAELRVENEKLKEQIKIITKE